MSAKNFHRGCLGLKKPCNLSARAWFKAILDQSPNNLFYLGKVLVWLRHNSFRMSLFIRWMLIICVPFFTNNSLAMKGLPRDDSTNSPPTYDHPHHGNRSPIDQALAILSVGDPSGPAKVFQEVCLQKNPSPRAGRTPKRRVRRTSSPPPLMAEAPDTGLSQYGRCTGSVLRRHTPPPPEVDDDVEMSSSNADERKRRFPEYGVKSDPISIPSSRRQIPVRATMQESLQPFFFVCDSFGSSLGSASTLSAFTYTPPTSQNSWLVPHKCSPTDSIDTPGSDWASSLEPFASGTDESKSGMISPDSLNENSMADDEESSEPQSTSGIVPIEVKPVTLDGTVTYDFSSVIRQLYLIEAQTHNNNEQQRRRVKRLITKFVARSARYKDYTDPQKKQVVEDCMVLINADQRSFEEQTEHLHS